MTRHGAQGVRFAVTMYKLYLAAEVKDFDLAVCVDMDTFMNPAAPCLSTCIDQIPSGGFAAVNDVPFEKRARFFPEWDEDHYQEVERCLGSEMDIPDRKQHINSGLLVFRPREVAERWRELADMDSPLHEEWRLSVYELQQGKCFLLQPEWNVVWQYYVREHFPYLERPPRHNRILHRANSLIARTIARPIERRHLMATLSKSFMVHLAGQNGKVGLLQCVRPEQIDRAGSARLWRGRLYL